MTGGSTESSIMSDFPSIEGFVEAYLFRIQIVLLLALVKLIIKRRFEHDFTVFNSSSNAETRKF